MKVVCFLTAFIMSPLPEMKPKQFAAKIRCNVTITVLINKIQ